MEDSSMGTTTISAISDTATTSDTATSTAE
jgi:hypothetical protein